MIVDQVEPVLGEVVIVTYEGEYSSDGRLFHGTASAVLDNRCKYDGSFRNGMFHGKGVFQWPSGVKFEGDFERGQIVGKGQYEWSDGSIYIGDVLDGRRHGSGKFVGSSGQVYEGEWVAGKRHGKGKVYYNEERTSSFTGDWVANLRHGYGTMKYASGNSYEGEWRDDKKSGAGLMVWRDVDEVYTGQWSADLPHGLGEHIWGDSSSHSVKKEMCNIYRGNFVEGRREGHGTFFYMNGSQYTGQWHADAKQGEGLFLYADGRVFGGMFHQNRMITDYSKEESSAPRATEAVNPQFKLNIGDLFDSYPALLQSAAAVQPAARAAAGAAVRISTVRVNDSGVSGAERRQREVTEMERLLLKYNHYLRSALRRYADFANKRRLQHALQQHQLLSAWAPTDVPSRAHKACATARIFPKRLFCMNLEQMLRFLRECGVVGPFFRSYDLSQCMLQMRDELKLACVEKLRTYRQQMRAAEIGASADGAGVEDSEVLLESEEELERYLGLRVETVMDPYLHANARDGAFATLASQPLLEREFVELFVRAVAVKYARCRGIGPHYSEEMAAVAGMSLTQILYYVLAQKLMPMLTDIEENVPAFYHEFYFDEVQTLLLSNEVQSAPHGLGAADAHTPQQAAAAAARSPPAGARAPSNVAFAEGSDATRDGVNPAGTVTPTCFEKLWAHLRRVSQEGPQNDEPSTPGPQLAEMHSAGPPALSENRTGGSIQLKALLDFFLALRGTVIAADASAFALMVAMECVPPSPASMTPAPVPASHASPPASEKVASREHKEGGEAGEEALQTADHAQLPPPLPDAQDFDLTCAESRIDFQDFLELVCRVICSRWWTYAGASPSNLLPAGKPAHLAVGEAAEDQDSASVYSVSIADILAERIGAWKQGFDFDALHLPPAPALSAAPDGMPSTQ